MAKRNYERLEIVPFGEHLLRTGDLDPVYIALHRLANETDRMSTRQLRRWLVAYWCCYHCGAASYLSEQEGPEFWKQLEEAARNETFTPIDTRWPRGAERRHWRGKQALTCVSGLREQFVYPEMVVDYIAEDGGAFESVAARAKTLPLFGPWISFKVCDMVDRVLGIDVDFSEAAVFMFKDPVKAAIMLFKQQAFKDPRTPRTIKPKEEKVIPLVLQYLEENLGGTLAPPDYERDVGLQEYETILCKWKSHMNGHYPLWNDIREIHRGVAPWARVSNTARLFLEAMPKELTNVEDEAPTLNE